MEFDKLFDSPDGVVSYKGRRLVRLDRIQLPGEETTLKVRFVSTQSRWKQGVALESEGDFLVNTLGIPGKVTLWEHTAPKEVDLVLNSVGRMLTVYNLWKDAEQLLDYECHKGGSAMYVETENGVRRYFCNDGDPDDDFTDLVFEIEIGMKQASQDLDT